MNVSTYDLMLDENQHNKLVKKEDYVCDSSILTSPEAVQKFMNSVFKLNQRAEEYAYMVCGNSRGKVVGVFELAHGTVNTCLLNTREVMIRALLCAAVSIKLIHNHPGEDPTPSAEDLRISKKFKEATGFMGLKYDDFLIIGGTKYYSLRENDLL